MTPHVITKGKFFPSKDLLEKKLEDLRAQAKQANLPIQLKLSCEIMITEDGLNYLQEGSFWGYQDTDYVLIEFMPPFEEKLIQEALYELKCQHKKVIVAHPERYFSNPKIALETVRSWIALGAHFQVNRTSIFVDSKASTRSVALALIDHNLISLIASDAHHAPGRRECRMEDIHTELIRLFDQKTADTLCIDNPTHLSDNQSLVKTTLSQSWFSHQVRAYRFKNSRRI